MVKQCDVTIDQEACVACAACTAVCHSQALIMRGLTLELKSELCDNCILCIQVCPTGALSKCKEPSHR